MKHLLFCIISLALVQVSLAQKKTPYIGKYEAFLEKDEKEEVTQYHTMLSKKKDGSYVFRQFFPETMMMTQMITYSKDKKTKNGLYKRFSDEGKLTSAGIYQKDKESGEWFESGLGKGQYKDGKKEGEWIETYQNGQLASAYNFINNKREGSFIIYDSLGNITNEGIYRSDTIFSQSNHKATIKEGPLKKVEIMPIMISPSCTQLDMDEKKKCSELAMLNYIAKTLRYPAEARQNDVEGIAVVQFVIEKDGSIKEVNVIRGICQSIKDEVTRVVKSFPKWSPGYQDGQPVRVLYTLPVKFKLEG